MDGNNVAIDSIPGLIGVMAIMFGGLALAMGQKQWAARLLAVGFAMILVAALASVVWEALPTWLNFLVAIAAFSVVCSGLYRRLPGRRRHPFIHSRVLGRGADIESRTTKPDR